MDANKNNTRIKNRIKLIVVNALMLAIAIILSIIENALPPLPIAVPGVKFGLSNIIVMFILFFIGRSNAFLIAILKSFFVVITRGYMAGFLSLLGGIISISIMIILMVTFKEKISYMILSVFGAVFHNIGQFIAINIIFVDFSIWSYLPVLLISGVIAGIITATLLKFILPGLKKLI